MGRSICTGHPWAGHALIPLFLFMLAVSAGCGIESSNRPSVENNSEASEAEELSAPALRTPADESTVETDSPVLDWDDVSAATAYQVQVSTTSDFSDLELDREVSTSSFTSDDFILIRGIHYWRVRAKDDTGKLSPWSMVRSFTIANARAKGLTSAVITHPETDTTIFKGGSIDCAGSLMDGGHPPRCIWEIGDMGVCEDNPAPSALRFNEIGIYLVRFTAFTLDGAKSSDEVTITVIDETPVLNLPEDGDTAGSTVEFSWEPVEGAASYIISISGKGEGNGFNYPVSGLSCEIDFADPGEYCWYVYAVDLQGNVSPCSLLRYFTVL